MTVLSDHEIEYRNALAGDAMMVWADVMKIAEPNLTTQLQKALAVLPSDAFVKKTTRALIKAHSFHSFADFLGYPKGKNFTVDIENPEVMDVLRKITGPYGKVIIKIIAARKQP